MKKVSGRVFFAVLSVSTLVSALACLLIYREYSDSYRTGFVGNYRERLALVSSSLVQLETAADIIAANANEVLRNLDKQSGPPSNAQLAHLASELNVAHFFITDRNGKFIRSTNGSPESIKSSLFDYCADYKHLVTGKARVAQTPIIPSSDELVAGPFKYTMMPNFDRSRILEVSVPLDFIRKTLGAAIASDPHIKSLTLFSPSGVALGHVSHGLGSSPVSEIKYFSEVVLTNELLQLQAKVPASVENCCECKMKNVADKNGRYYYVLKAEISLSPLAVSLGAVKAQVSAIFLMIFLGSIFASHAVSRVLVGRLEVVSKGVQAIIETGDMSSRLNLEGSDEIADLAGRFDQMVENLERVQTQLISAERDKILAELATQLAHDIRAPLSALRAAVVISDINQSESRELLSAGVARIEDIASTLLEKRRLLQVRGPEVDLDALVRELIQERKASWSSDVEVAVSLSGDPLFVKVDSTELKRVVSNLLQNAYESLRPEYRKIDVQTINRGKISQLRIRDYGVGVSDEVVAGLRTGEFKTTKDEGNALGLKFAVACAEEWGGMLHLSKSEPGTEVILSLPLIV